MRIAPPSPGPPLAYELIGITKTFDGTVALTDLFQSVVIVVGLAVVERESWVICGYEPQGNDEVARLDAERQKLGFDPRLLSHDLTACKNDQAKGQQMLFIVLTATFVNGASTPAGAPASAPPSTGGR